MDYVKRFYNIINKMIITSEEFNEIINNGIVTSCFKKGTSETYPDTVEYLLETNCDDEHRVYVIEK